MSDLGPLLQTQRTFTIDPPARAIYALTPAEVSARIVLRRSEGRELTREQAVAEIGRERFNANTAPLGLNIHRFHDTSLDETVLGSGSRGAFEAGLVRLLFEEERRAIAKRTAERPIFTSEDFRPGTQLVGEVRVDSFRGAVRIQYGSVEAV